MFITFFFINILWVLFRADNIHIARVIIQSMFDNHELYLTTAYTSHLPSIIPNTANMIILVVAMLFGLFGPTTYQLMTEYRYTTVKQIAIVVSFVVGTLFISRVVTFLYFNF